MKRVILSILVVFFVLSGCGDNKESKTSARTGSSQNIGIASAMTIESMFL